MTAARPSRRTLVLLGAVAAGLSACGFHLRQPADLPYSRIALAGFAKRSHMAEALRRNLPPSARLVDNARDAEVVVQALDDRFTKTVVASTAAGQVREFRLRATLRFRITQPDGKLLSEDAELEQMRDLSYTESAALGKEAEEAMLVREMHNDIAEQLLQRLAAVGRRLPR
jgi:LPS-assembly lipoprotein